MPTNQGPLVVAGFILGMGFPLWPVPLIALVLARGLNLLSVMLITWAVFLLSWICARLFSVPAIVDVIPEPLNTMLFFAAGGIIFLGWLFRQR